MTTDDKAVAFAWTATSGYKHYPPYVNLTGNRLAVRGAETTGEDGHPQTGPYVTVELPDEALAGLRASLTQPKAERENGDAGDAIDFACDHAGEPIFFLEDWRKDGAIEWLEYQRWLAVQREGAKRARAAQPKADEDVVERRLADALKLIRFHATPLNSDTSETLRKDMTAIRGIVDALAAMSKG